MMTRDETCAKGGTGVKVRRRRKRGTRRETAAEAMCLYCVYLIEAVRLKSWDALLHHRRVKFPLCAHHNESPGVLREVHPADKCRHFRARRKPAERIAVRQPADPSIRYIPLTHRHVTIVDAADYAWLGRYRWFTKGGASGKYYAGRSVRGQIILMHREIMKPPKGMVVDHINGNSLDNRRCNLRICTPAQNQHNRRFTGNISGYAGVYPQGKRWRAQVQSRGRVVYRELFDDKVEAAKARDAKAKEVYGEFACLNFPEER